MHYGGQSENPKSDPDKHTPLRSKQSTRKTKDRDHLDAKEKYFNSSDFYSSGREYEPPESGSDESVYDNNDFDISDVTHDISLLYEVTKKKVIVPN